MPPLKFVVLPASLADGRVGGEGDRAAEGRCTRGTGRTLTMDCAGAVAGPRQEDGIRKCVGAGLGIDVGPEGQPPPEVTVIVPVPRGDVALVVFTSSRPELMMMLPVKPLWDAETANTSS